VEATHQKIKDVLATVLANGMSAGEISDDADLVEDYGLDSLQMISFLLGVEDVFDIALDYDSLDLGDLRSVRQFAEWLSGHDTAVAR
jgi:acyl carrier protein